MQRLPGQTQRKILVFSGFVIDVCNEWIYITAGHILRDIRLATSAGSTFDIWRLGDQMAGSQFRNSTIPYSFLESDWLVIENEAIGLDYAAVPIRGLYRKQLEAGGVIAIGKDAWSDHVTDYDHWALIGIPAESVNYDGTNVITARIILVPIASSDEPESAGDKANNQFYAKPVDGSEQYFKDADGLSGGPVFTLKKVGACWLYNVMGIQSAWYPSSGKLAICPFSSFGLELERIMLGAKTSEQSGPSGGAA